MTASDPAVEAARRTLDRWTKDGWDASRDFVAEAAANEALAPLRTKMESLIAEHGACQSDSFSHGVLHALNELAEFVYRSDELE